MPPARTQVAKREFSKKSKLYNAVDEKRVLGGLCCRNGGILIISAGLTYRGKVSLVFG